MMKVPEGAHLPHVDLGYDLDFLSLRRQHYVALRSAL